MYGSIYDRVENRMNPTNLSYFEIKGLFQRYDVRLSFEKEVNIFIGENGLGKTTILNCLYFVLSRNFSQLETIDFQTILIGFKSNPQPYCMSKADLIVYNRGRNEHYSRYDDMIREFLLEEIHLSPELMSSLDEDQFNFLIRRLAITHEVPMALARKQLLHYLNTHQFKTAHPNKGDARHVRLLAKAINEQINENVIYLPTYRRIENDFTSLGSINNNSNNSELLIRFGMSDVQKSIDFVLDSIRNLAVQGYNELTGSLLEQYMQDDPLKGQTESIIDINIVRIVLDRLGGKIETKAKEHILTLIESNRIYDAQHMYLLNLLQKLISNYDLQKKYDDRINKFVSTCNKYLNDKVFYYNPSDLTLDVILNPGHGETVKLTQLSSGEKQIVSLFSKLYLESDEKNIVIIDEPELSLSIKWQQMLLPDIIRSQNCKLLLTVTHSPFVFDNEFDMDAEEIRAHMSLI